MAAVAADVRPRSPAPLRAHLVRHPDHVVVALAVLAGAALVVPAIAAALGGTGGAHHHGHGGGRAGPTGLPSPLAVGAGWMAMVVAMMLPVVAPQAVLVARRSFWGRRIRSVAGFLLGYVAVWGLFGLVALGGLRLAGVEAPPPAATAVALVVAAAWQVSPRRRRARRRCRSLVVRARRGVAADRDVLTSGWRVGARCAVVCGPVMAAMALGHGLALMAALTVLLHTERAPGPNPEARAGRPHEAIALLALAAAVALTG